MEKSNKLIKLIIAFCILFFLIYQYYVGFYSSITTESASYFEYTEGIDTVGTFIRNEETITSTKEGTVHFLVANGEKIAKDGTIANIYESDSASAAASRIVEIDNQLELIAKTEGYNDQTAVDVNTINARIGTYLNSFVLSAQDGRYSDVGKNVTELLTMMTRKQVATGEQSDFSSLKQSLSAEKAQLAASMGSPKGNIKSNAAGYFVSNVDGYEAVFTTDDLSAITPENLGNAKPGKIANGVIGKIVYDYEWYLAAPVSLSDSMHYKTGDNVKVKTDTSSSPELSASVVAINLSESGDDAVIVLRCNEMNSELASLRTAAVKIVKNEHSGIRVSTKAMRVLDGVTGVYVVSGMEAKFVTVKILFTNEKQGYILCEYNTADSSKLRLYDKIIVKGKSLYDGKIIY